MIIKKEAWIIALIIILAVGLAYASTFVDDTQAEFDQGTYSNTEWDTDHVELSAAQTSGNYTSQIFNPGSSATWNNISWTQGAPYQQELPDNKAVETVLGGIDMTGNVLLLHINNNWNDASGEGNNGTASGATFSASSKLGSHAGSFDGSNDKVNCGSDSSLNIQTTLTVSAWINLDTVTPAHGFHSSIIGDNANSNWWFYIGNNAKLGFLRFNGAGYDAVGSNSNIVAGTWTHVAVTYNNSATNEVKLYINGQLDIEGSLDPPINALSDYIVVGDRGDTHRLDGLIDELALWNRTLSDDEILNIYKRGALELNLTARSCDDSACSGESWTDLIDTSPQDLSVANNTYFQYKFDFETDNASYSPEVYNVTVDYTANQAPSISSVTLTTTDPTTNNTNQNLTGTVSASDGDGDNITYIYNWYRNDTLNSTTLIENGLVSYWSLNNDSLDYHGSNDGTNNGATLTTNGKVGGAYDFDGSDDYISISHSELLFDSPITVGAWIMIDTVTGVKGIAACGYGAGTPHWLFQVNGDKLRVYVKNAYYSGGTSLSTGTWYHVAFAGTAATGGKIYLNGVEDGTISPWTTGGGTDVRIGTTGGAQFFDGKTDEFAIYNRTLSTTEIQQLYQGSAYGGNIMNASQTSEGDEWVVGVKAGDHNSWSGETNSSVVTIQSANQNPPQITLNAPDNASSSDETYRLLNATVTDGDGDNMDVVFYGSYNSQDNFYAINTTTEVSNGNDVVFNWTEKQLDPDDDMVLLYHINEDSGTIVDYSGQGNNGTYNGALYSEDGKFNTGIGFDGSDDVVTVSDDPSLNINTSYSISAWIKPNTVSGLYTIVAKGQSVWEMMMMVNNGQFGAGFENCADDNFLGFGGTLTAGTWQYVTYVYNGSRVLGYIDGIEVVNVDGSGTPCLKGFSLGIGQAPEGYLYPFNGTIDEVAIWNRSLSENEIQELYELQAGTYYWYANATDGTYPTQSGIRQFTIESDPPSSATNLAEQSMGSSWIYWNWTNPSDYDFNENIVYINGSNVANTSNNYYNATGLNAHTNYTITVHTIDDYGYINNTDVNDTAETTNTAPSVSNVTITPSNASSTDNLTCNYTFSDADGDSESGTTFAWYKNNVSQNLTTQTIDNSNTAGAEQWTCQVTPSDGIDTGAAVNSSAITIQNGAPSAVNLTLTSTDSQNRTNGTLQANYTFSDQDAGDTEQDNNLKWYKDSVEQSALENSTTVASFYTSKGEVWKFSVRVNDGIVWGDWTNSSALTIQNTPPTAPIVDVLPNIPNDDDDLAVSITTSSTDADNDTITYSYQWYKNNGSQAGQTSSTLSNLLTSVGEIWKCIVTSNDGTGDGTSGEDSVTINGTVVPTYIINIISPTNGATWSSSNDITFEYNTTINTTKCSLIVDQEIKQNDTNITANTTESFVQTLSNAAYTWSVNCTDVNNKTNSSATWSLTVSYLYCGDGSCNNGESCSSCSADCGACSPGGGGGGGSPPILPTNTTTCVESWSCSDWYECVNGVQARTCLDANSCDTSQDKPLEKRSCQEVEQIEEVQEELVIPEEEVEKITQNENKYEFKAPKNKKLSFKYLGKEYYLTIQEIKDDKAFLTITPGPVEANLLLNQPTNVDLDSDGVPDIRLVLKSIEEDQAEITIVLLGPGIGAITGESIAVYPYQAPNPYFLVPTILLLLVFIVLIVVRKSHLSKKTKKLVTTLHISLIVIILVIFTSTFIKEGPLGNYLVNTTLSEAANSNTITSLTPKLMIVGFLIAAASTILIFVERKKIEAYLKERRKKSKKKNLKKKKRS